METEQLNIRIPSDLDQWIKSEIHLKGVKKKDLVVGVLEKARRGEIIPNLFDTVMRPPAAVPTGPETMPFSFVDLFAGIGGFRLGLERCGGNCVFTSEWDVNSQRTYKSWFGEAHVHGDITKINPTEIPHHVILAGGFPCQPFSIAGVSKKNSLGRAHGFACATQGTLFYNIATIIEAKRPPVVMLENVKNLLGHDKGKTWEVIHSTLTELRYRVFHKVIDAANYVPQHRERVYIVAFDKDLFGDNPPFEFPLPPAGPKPKFRDILEERPEAKYTLTDHLWEYLQEYAKRHKAKGNGFGFGMTDLDGVSRTLSARYFKDGSEVLIPQGPKKNPRRLTPRECARLMGYPDDLKIVVSDTQAYRQFGNSLVPAIAEAVGHQVVKTLCWAMRGNGPGCPSHALKLQSGQLASVG